MRRIRLFILLTIITAVLWSAPVRSEAAENNSLVTESELNQELNNSDTVIIDVSPPEVYLQGHLPGAVNLWRPDIVNSQGVLSNMLAAPEQIEAVLSRLGIKGQDKIVIYAQTPFDATRLWWTLKVYNHPDVKILNGNLLTWQEKGYAIDKEIPTRVRSAYTLDPSAVNTQMIAYTNQVSAALGGGSSLVDARSYNEYSGKVLNPGADRRGRIPGAVNIYWKDQLDCSGRFKAVEELRQIYAKQGITGDTPVIVYCHSGFQSSLNYFVLTQLLGYQNVRNYDASWIGWSKDKNLSMACDYSLFTIGSLVYNHQGISGQMDAAPYIKNGRIYLSLKYLSLVLGIPEKDLRWDSNSVFLSKGGKTVKVSLNKRSIWIDGQESSIDVPPEIVPPGRIMLPGRALAEVFNGEVTWDQSQGNIWIRSKDENTPVNTKST